MVANNLNFEGAVRIFYKIADLPMDHGDGEGCHVRMSKMVNLLKAEGLEPKIACAFARFDEPLWVEGHKRMQELRGWKYHTAPVLTVLDENGMARDLILDPGLFDGPVSSKQWLKHMSGRPDGLKIVPASEVAEGRQSMHYPIQVKLLNEREIRLNTEITGYQDAGKKRLVALSKECNRFFQKKRTISRARMGQSWTSRSKMGR